MTADTPALRLTKLIDRREDMRRQAKALDAEIRQARIALRSEEAQERHEERRQRILVQRTSKRALADALLAKFKL